MTERIGFVGLGNMGVPMSARLARAGVRLTVFDIDPARSAAQAAATGARAAADLAALGAAADIVVTMLPTGAIVRQVLLDGGLAAALAPGALVIDMSSSEPEGSVALAAALAARGIGFVDAPVSGAVPRAEAGTLAIMAGAADEGTFARAEPVLHLMGDRLFRTGAIGTGHAMKALNNFVAAAGFAAGAEAMILAARFGLNPGTALEIMKVSTGRNFSTELTLPGEVLTRRFRSGFGLGLLAKDVGIAAGLARGLGAGLPFVAATGAWWDRARDGLGPARDHTEAFLHWEAQAAPDPSRPVVPQRRHFCDLNVELGPIREMGTGRAGRRRIVPIVGGRVEGPGIAGRILDVGADWQTILLDGSAELDTRYAFETEDGAVIEIVNFGLRHGPPEVIAALAAGQEVAPGSYYMRTHARLETGDPRWSWVNRMLFVGSGTRQRAAVRMALHVIE